MQRRLSFLLFSFALSTAIGCSDDGDSGTDAGTTPDASADATDAAHDGSGAPDAVADATDTTQDIAQDGAGDGSGDVADAVADADASLGYWEDWSAAEPGPYNVGHRVLETSYQAPWHDEPREITVSVWYPTLAEDGPPGFYVDTFRDGDVIADAPPAPSPYFIAEDEQGYPVHLHSHGSQGYSGTSAFLMRHFASHGWVAIAPDHVGNLLIDDIQPRPAATYLNRPADLTAALDAVEALPADDPLAGAVRTQEVLLSGHSYGVYTAWAAAGATYYMPAVEEQCASLGCSDEELVAFERGVGDDRVVALMPMAGSYRESWFGSLGHRAVEVPVLAMSGTDDPVGADQQCEITSGLSLAWIDIEGACHQAFALGGCALLETRRGYDIINHYAMAWARDILLGVGESDGLLGEAADTYPEVHLRGHDDELPLDVERWGEPIGDPREERVWDHFEGVRIVNRTTVTPRPLSYWVALIDPTADGIDFTVTPDNGDDPRETTRQYTRHFVDEVGATIGINANFFSPWPAEDAYAEVIGLAASDGDVYSGFDGGYDVGIAFAPDGTPTLVREAEGSGDEVAWTPDVEIDDAVGASQQILTDGVNTGSDGDLHPRTGIGITDAGHLVLIVVDGRQEGVSEGVTTAELADMLAEFGAVDAINLDGGGSSTFVVAEPRAEVRNVSVGYQFPGTERDNGNNLAIFAGPRLRTAACE